MDESAAEAQRKAAQVAGVTDVLGTAAIGTLALKKAGVKKLLLGHYSTRYKDPTPLLDEARKIFDETYLTHEGETIYLNE